MAELRDVDETDLEIIRLLSEDARRPFSNIAEHVGLSAPAVSDRVDRLKEQGLITRFTVELDRTAIQRRIPVLIELVVEPPAIDEAFQTITGLDGVEHSFKTLDGTIVVHATAPDSSMGDWLDQGLDKDVLQSVNVTLLEEYQWKPSADQVAFSITCPVCGNSVDDDGVTIEIGGEIKSFCCPSCRAAYEERYEEHRSKA